MTLPRDAAATASNTGGPLAASTHSPSGRGTYDLPVPFPAAGIVVWFSTSALRFKTPAGADHTVSYGDIPGFTCLPTPSTSSRRMANTHAFVTDGVSSVAVMRTSGRDYYGTNNI